VPTVWVLCFGRRLFFFMNLNLLADFRPFPNTNSDRMYACRLYQQDSEMAGLRDKASLGRIVGLHHGISPWLLLVHYATNISHPPRCGTTLSFAHIVAIFTT
jgi:hypothetical protein